MKKFKITLTKNRSEDEIAINVDATQYSLAYNLGCALAQLMGTDEEYCYKQERVIDKHWAADVNEVE